MEFAHISVLQNEVIKSLRAVDGGVFLDATVGGAGHTIAILEANAANSVICIDQDEAALQAARERLARWPSRVQLCKANFAQLEQVLKSCGTNKVNGILFDLGVSSPQLDQAERGFSYQHDAPLDMRMDVTQGRSGADLVNQASSEELAKIIYQYGEERWAKRIAANIVRVRQIRAISTTGELVEVIKEAIPAAARRSGPHPARRTFQALRIAVNNELENLEKGLQAAVNSLYPEGRIAVITFHSLEDRIVKHFFRTEADPCTCPVSLPVCVCNKQPRLKLITPRGITPSAAELASNPRARSARLRVAQRVL